MNVSHLETLQTQMMMNCMKTKLRMEMTCLFFLLIFFMSLSSTQLGQMSILLERFEAISGCLFQYLPAIVECFHEYLINLAGLHEDCGEYQSWTHSREELEELTAGGIEADVEEEDRGDLAEYGSAEYEENERTSYRSEVV